MRVLIIGGTGLISNSVTRQLLEAGHDVVHWNRGKTAGLGPEVRTMHGDRREFAAFARAMEREGQWDAVIDMICYKPDEAQQLVDVFRGHAGQLIVASTIDVYAKPASKYPIGEDEPHGGLNDYARNKSACEKLLLGASDSELPVTILRACHIYGPGSVHRGHVVHTFGGRTTFLDRLKNGKAVVVHGDGSSFWTSCHADDMAKAFVGALANERAFGKAYHATPDEWLTWNRYHEQVAEAMGAPRPEMVHIPTDALERLVPERSVFVRENFQFNNIFDNTAAKRDLGFEARVPFREGMQQTIEWVRETGGFEDSASEPWYDHLLERWKVIVG